MTKKAFVMWDVLRGRKLPVATFVPSSSSRQNKAEMKSRGDGLSGGRTREQKIGVGGSGAHFFNYISERLSFSSSSSIQKSNTRSICHGGPDGQLFQWCFPMLRNFATHRGEWKRGQKKPERRSSGQEQWKGEKKVNWRWNGGNS